VFVARVETVHCRSARDRDSHAQSNLPPYSLDRLTHVLCIHDVSVALTPRRFDLAWLPFSNTDRFLSRAELMASVWGARADINSHSLAQHMHALRLKPDLWPATATSCGPYTAPAIASRYLSNRGQPVTPGAWRLRFNDRQMCFGA